MFATNSGGLVIGCIDADFCNKIATLQLLLSTRFMHFFTFESKSGYHGKRLYKAPPGRETMHRRKNSKTKTTKRGLEESMKSTARIEPRHHLHTQLSVCTTKKLSCMQTRKNCLLKLINRVSGSLKMRGPAPASPRGREHERGPTENKRRA